jgi:DNA-binding response OmpR family regulator
LKILIAEDDAFFRRLLQRIFAAEFEVVMVEDGIEAWDLLQRMEGPALAILDWVMPGMAGPEICWAARANPKTANMYLILVTARHSSADILAGLRSGADDYVTKPFNPDELRARVHLGKRIIQLAQSLAMQNAALESVRAREVSLQNRLAEMESSAQEAVAKEAATSASYYPSSRDSLTQPTEFTAAKSSSPLLPVNNSKVS